MTRQPSSPDAHTRGPGDDQRSIRTAGKPLTASSGLARQGSPLQLTGPSRLPPTGGLRPALTALLLLNRLTLRRSARARPTSARLAPAKAKPCRSTSGALLTKPAPSDMPLYERRPIDKTRSFRH